MPGGWQTLNPEKVDAKVIEWLRATTRENLDAVIGRYAWVSGVDFKDRIKDIRVPTLLMNMGGSYQVPLHQGTFMQQVNPNIKLVTLDGNYGAPNIQLVVPDRLAEHTLAFLEDLPRISVRVGGW